MDGTSIEEIVGDAIRQRLRIEIEYQGSAPGLRTVDPHALFRTGHGRTFLHAFQVDGASTSGKIPAWRQFDLAEISTARTLVTRFELAEGYDPSASTYSAGLLVAAS